MTLPNDYTERVYAGVLGKLIGVYLGRPFEGWTHEHIMKELGEIWYYVHEKLNVPLIVTDDDISGTFTFLRALPDYGNSPEIDAQKIGQTWLNYLIEERTILWWGGMGNSTEHTAYLRLKNGIPAPRSGSMALNGQTVAEQIGAQIFIDGWSMVAPGKPELAADLAHRAASVSHDGEAICGAQVVAAIEAQAFVESDIDKLIDTGLSVIPDDSLIYQMINEIREWHAQEPDDWKSTREKIAAKYGYDKYGGNCHMIPNHALIIHSLLHGDDDFQKTLMIVNTCGWDTDCNSGNVGCIMGIKNGLDGLTTGADFRTPVADRMYLPTADGGRSITDAVTETFHVANIGRHLAGETRLSPKSGARFHFELPGAVQGFQVEQIIESANTATLENVPGHSADGDRSLAIRLTDVAPGRRACVATNTFIPSKEIAQYFDGRGYSLLASPTLHPGQTVSARVVADEDNQQPVTCTLYLRCYQGPDDEQVMVRGSEVLLKPAQDEVLRWEIPSLDGKPISQIGLAFSSSTRAEGTVYLDYLTWRGTPRVTFSDPGDGSTLWRNAWVNGVDGYVHRRAEPYRLVQNEGRGLLIQGSRDWQDYQVRSEITLHMVEAAGIAARVQGMQRYYALLLSKALEGRNVESLEQSGTDNNQGVARLVKVLDGETVLAEQAYTWSYGDAVDFQLRVTDNRLQASLNGNLLFNVEDTDRPLQSGGIAYVVEEGRIMSEAIELTP